MHFLNVGNKWLKIHESKCTYKEFWILTVLNGFEVELVEEKKKEIKEILPVSTSKLRHFLIMHFGN